MDPGQAQSRAAAVDRRPRLTPGDARHRHHHRRARAPARCSVDYKTNGAQADMAMAMGSYAELLE
ncbi:hypothetical protein [Streptomyces violascens]|uniref:hypothetical protein n=1 Tax=Streptomyces violascens TaxID=67381 RepID=UPI0036CA02CC